MLVMPGSSIKLRHKLRLTLPLPGPRDVVASQVIVREFSVQFKTGPPLLISLPMASIPVPMFVAEVQRLLALAQSLLPSAESILNWASTRCCSLEDGHFITPSRRP